MSGSQCSTGMSPEVVGKGLAVVAGGLVVVSWGTDVVKGLLEGVGDAVVVGGFELGDGATTSQDKHQ